MSDATFAAVRQALAEQLGLDPETVGLGSAINEDLGADSLDAVELIMALEERYGINIETADAEGLRTVGDVVELIDRLK
jgi:acyl carrier protein